MKTTHHHTIVRHEIMCAPGVQPFKDACSCNNPRMKGKTKKEKQLFFTEVGLWMSLIFPLKFLWTLFYKQMFIYKWTDVQNPSRLQHSNFHVQIKWLNYTSQYFPMIFLNPQLRWGERRFHSPVHFHLPPCLELKPNPQHSSLSRDQPLLQGRITINSRLSIHSYLADSLKRKRGWQNSTEHKTTWNLQYYIHFHPTIHNFPQKFFLLHLWPDEMTL